jgi:Golgi nucleoside diphosphatase
MTSSERHSIEARDSWETHLERHDASSDTVDEEADQSQRYLKHYHHHHKHNDNLPNLAQLEEDREETYLNAHDAKVEESKNKATRKHKKLMKKLFHDSGIKDYTQHGLMIDAGSTGSRMHLYEWEPRVLLGLEDVQEAVSGRKLSYPDTESRWTDRLRPGIASFASLPDDQLLQGIAHYLSPLMDFAQTILREKQDDFDNFPIYLRATAGMRILSKLDRSRVLGAVRTLFSNKTYCPFYFEDEFARVLAGEEEAIFGWAGINFAMGNLVEESEGMGTVVSPKLSYGALDMGGASTQISFYEPNEDIMANLFKLQIGQGKHWNLYAHSFLYYGINEARNRLHAYILEGKGVTERLVDGVHNPCLPGGSRQDVRLSIHIDSVGEETWEYTGDDSQNGFYQAILKNDNDKGDFDACMDYAKGILHLDKNKWCDFAHRGECAINSIYMPELPTQSDNFGEFLAFSNYYEVFSFLALPERASIGQLRNATKFVCSMSKKEIFDFNKAHAKADDDEVEDYCFRASYAFQLLHNGYGFQLDEYITATNVLNGQKVGWALGAMLYELNTSPWEYIGSRHSDRLDAPSAGNFHPILLVLLMLAGIGISMVAMFSARSRRNRSYYQPIKEETIALKSMKV